MEHNQRANFVLGHGSVAPKMMSSPTRSIDMGYHTLNGDNSLSPLEHCETSLGGINLACPSVSHVMLEGPLVENSRTLTVCWINI